ncbi:uncharacterized protein LOC122510260 [Leptopilina heterotoma]|uniref:uncharacterized protein LOC122510260 n=1 Tax=Leptopilina heterotoma TaxID=63436 RepID=UPI001CA7C398|nr:uncharacterized protein LOC122510260 [Leptopilina heterotoma]
MYGVAEHINRTGNLPEWCIITRKLKNYQSYNLLRYHFPLGSYNLRSTLAGKPINFLRKWFFQNASILNTQILVESYYKRKLVDLMSFEDYYTIMILLKNVSVLNVDAPASWRMRRALYSLAIRQYSSNAIMNYIPKTCLFKKKETKTFVDDIKTGDSFEKITFTICSSKYEEPLSYVPENLNFNFSSYWVHYELVITDPILMVSLADVVKSDDEEIYVILPKIDLTVISETTFLITNGEPNLYLKLVTSPIYARSNWLTELANEVEKYKEMELEYINRQG